MDIHLRFGPPSRNRAAALLNGRFWRKAADELGTARRILTLRLVQV
jgi:hypothetical protein